MALLGANGAGKTTTLKAISGLLTAEMGRVTEGIIEFEGARIDREEPRKIVMMGIVQVMEGRRVLEHMTVQENLLAGAMLRHHGAETRRDIDQVCSYFPQLGRLRRECAGYLSGGEQQMLVIGRALMAHPRLMLLDEPSLGLSPILCHQIFDTLKRINVENKVSMLLVEQNANAALSIADYGYVLENGRPVLDGPADRLKDNEDIREFYLGLGEGRGYRHVKHYRRRKRWLG